MRASPSGSVSFPRTPGAPTESVDPVATEYASPTATGARFTETGTTVIDRVVVPVPKPLYAVRRTVRVAGPP